jgi:outer membrane immunogenic protein
MRRLGSGLLAGVIVAASVAAAAAADLPVPAPVAPAYRPVVYDWSGIYVGGQIGAGNQRDTFTQLATTALFPIGSTDRTNPWSVVGGVEAGVNLQFSSIVVGVEGTWTASLLSGTQVTPSPLAASTSVYQTSASHWYATADARIGYAANDILFFVKGGAAWVSATYSEQPYSFNGYNVQQSINSVRTGWTIGGGIEYGIGENLSLKLEYDYLDFGARNYNFNSLSFMSTTGGGAITPVVMPVSVKSTVSLITAGVNWRFNWH